MLSLLPSRNPEWSFAKKSALLQCGPLKKDLAFRWSFLLLGFTLMLMAPIFGAIIVLAGEWFARKLFFRAVAAPKMAGTVTSQSRH